MIGSIIDGVAGLFSTTLDKFVENKGEAAKREVDLLKARMAVEVERYKEDHAETLKQIDVNIEQAKHPSLFVAGARPFILWIGGIAFAYVLIIRDVLILGFNISPYRVPEIDTGLLMTVLLGVLGIGGMRTWEKTKGVETRRISRKK